ncbi:hypothetical protein PFZ49_10070 [Microbacterium lacticum]|uniref:hypothetical protein n=1 Tax=Microbacterium lacticum TaxID=33885 RepID=UPI003A86F9EF
MSTAASEIRTPTAMGTGWWKVAVILLVVKLAQWGILAITLITGPLPGLPEVILGSHMVAGCWVGSSLVFLFWRRWLGVLSSAAYSVLSLIVSTVSLIEGSNVAWNLLTAIGSAGIVVALTLSIFQRSYHHSRW